jgi:membrane peptidoglycan carboxypeptidase
MRGASESGNRASSLLGAFLAVSLVMGLLLAGLALPAAFVTGSATRGGVDFFNSLPADLAEPPLPEQTTVLDSKGAPIAHFYDEHRISVPLSRIAMVMRQAIVAIEDSRFYQHGGVDAKGLLRAFINNQMSEDGRVQGASTLTQQYVKLRILESALADGDEAGANAALSQTYARKFQEIRLAISLEKRKSKDEILEDYLNIANFGDSTYGIEAAAQYFFGGTTAANLTLPQAALLAGLVQSPGPYNPFLHAQAATNRRNTVLARMHDLKVISDTEFAAATAAPLGVKKTPATNGCVTAHEDGYFCAFLRNVMLKDDSFSSLGKTEAERAVTLKRGGLTIRTTVNAAIQAAAYNSLTEKVPIGDPSGVGTAAVTVEPGTGKILAMAQNRQYDPASKPGHTEINYSVDKSVGSGNGFQTGSTFKAFTLAAWLAKGKGLYDVVDATKRPFHPSEFQTCNGPASGPDWPPNNSEGHEGGSMTVMDATRNSVNVAFVDMATKVGLCDIKTLATKLGVHKAYAYDGGECQGKSTEELPDCAPSMVLGAMDIAPLTMAAAYAAFAADGMYCKPLLVASITDRDGKALAVPSPSCTQAIDPAVAHGVTYALKQVLVNGTAGGQGIGRPAAGKTGTTDDSKDTWFIGYTPQLSTAVWVGWNPDPGSEGRKGLRSLKIGDRFFGGQIYGATIAAPIWRQIMKSASEGLPEKDWPNPTGKMLEGSSVKLPDVTGQPLDQATAILTDAGFSVSVGNPIPSDLGPDQVAGTSPAGGSRVAPKSHVTLLPGDGSGGGATPGNAKAGGTLPGAGGIRPPIKPPGVGKVKLPAPPKKPTR